MAGSESLTVWLIVGFVVIFAGMTVSELTPTLLDKRAAKHVCAGSGDRDEDGENSRQEGGSNEK